MSNSKKLTNAALVGLFAASILTAGNSFAANEAKSSCNGKDKVSAEKANCKTADGKEKHACKGKNSCKGQGGDGKNSCKGKGSCSTQNK